MAGAVLVTVLCCVASLFSLRTELLQVPSQCVESPVYPSPPVYSPGKQGFKSKSTSAPVPLSGSGGGSVVGFDSTSAVKSRRSKNESGLQEGESSWQLPCARLQDAAPVLCHGLSGCSGVAPAAPAAPWEDTKPCPRLAGAGENVDVLLRHL